MRMVASERRREPPPLLCRARAAQVLLEFTIVAFAMTLLLAGLVTFGLATFGVNQVRQAAESGAQTYVRIEGADQSADVSEQYQFLKQHELFDRAQLIINVGTDPADLFAVNRQLLPLYIYDPDLQKLRYPGAVVNFDDGTESYPTVLIPIVGQGNRDPVTGVETISAWREVVEPLRLPAFPADPADGTPLVLGLRINYPFQSGALVAYQQVDTNGTVIPHADAIAQDGITNRSVEANDAAVTGASLPTGYTFATPTQDPSIQAGPHRGQYGLGEMQALGKMVRPYRKVISSEAIFPYQPSQP